MDNLFLAANNARSPKFAAQLFLEITPTPVIAVIAVRLVTASVQ